MTNMLILQFEYAEKDIYDNLAPWLNVSRPDIYNDIKQKLNDNPKTNYYQVGLAVKNDNNVNIITPFNIYTLYSSCKIINYGDKEIELSLNNYCYYTRLASYTIKQDNNDLSKDDNVVIKIKDYNFKINNLAKARIKTLNKDIILKDMDVVFKNIVNENIYPFVWIEAFDISNKYIDDIYETLISGSHVYKSNDILVGIVYNITDKITIIPMITIMNFMNNKLSNVFFDYLINENYISNNFYNEFNYLNITKKKDTEYIIPENNMEGNIMISQTYDIDNTYNFEIGDTIYSIDGKIINEEGEIFSSELRIYVPVHTYLWYNLHSKEHNFVIYRNKQRLEFRVKQENLIDKINLGVEKTTELLIKDDIIFCKPNLLMFEWLAHNSLYIRNYSYYQYRLNPYYNTLKQKYLFVGLNDTCHPDYIKEKLLKFNRSNEFIDIFTILSVNSKSPYVENCKKVKNLILCDIDETKIPLNWI